MRGRLKADEENGEVICMILEGDDVVRMEMD